MRYDICHQLLAAVPRFVSATRIILLAMVVNVQIMFFIAWRAHRKATKDARTFWIESLKMSSFRCFATYLPFGCKVWFLVSNIVGLWATIILSLRK